MSLRSLFAKYELTFEAVSNATKIPVLLFERIDSGRQALPIDVATKIASFLKIDVATVVSEVKRISTTGASIGSNPLPSEPILGEPLLPVQLHSVAPVDIERAEPLPGEWIWISSNGSPSWFYTPDFAYIVDVANEKLVGVINVSDDLSDGLTKRLGGLAYNSDSKRMVCVCHDPEVDGMTELVTYDARTLLLTDYFVGYDYRQQWACDYTPTDGLWKDSTLAGTSAGIQQLSGGLVLQNWVFTDSPNVEAISINLYENGFAYSLVWDPTNQTLTWRRCELSSGAMLDGSHNMFNPVGFYGSTHPVIDSLYIGDGSDYVFGLTIARIGGVLYTVQAGDAYDNSPPPIPIYATDMQTLVTNEIFPYGGDLPGYWMGGAVADDEGYLWISTVEWENDELLPSSFSFMVHKIEPTTGEIVAWYRMPNEPHAITSYLGIGIFAAGSVWFVYRVGDWDAFPNMYLGKFNRETAALESSILLHKNLFDPRVAFDITKADVGPFVEVKPAGS